MGKIIDVIYPYKPPYMSLNGLAIYHAQGYDYHSWQRPAQARDMRIENTSRIPTRELRALLTQVLKTAPIGKGARGYLQGKDGLFVTVHNAKYSRVAGRIYPNAITITRKGKVIPVRGYIKLFVFAKSTIDDIAHTFAHELSHFKDWYDSVTIHPEGYVETGKVPWGRERRAKAFADKVTKKLHKGKGN